MNILEDRTISSFPLSIGTGLALESIFDNTIERYDKDREIPNKVKIDNYKYHFFNLYTLSRNILSATNIKDKLSLLDNKHFIRILLEELDVIDSLYENTKCSPVYYIPDYNKVYIRFNKGKDDKFTKPYIELVSILAKLKSSKIKKDNVIYIDYKLPKTKEKSLITTSIASDLLSDISDLELLESHTGKLKGKWEWNSKLHGIGSNDISSLPFIEEILFLLGDKILVKPTKLSIRLELLKISKDKNWSIRTTSSKVRNDIKTYKLVNERLADFKTLF